MSTYAIYTPDQPSKYRGRFQAKTRGEAIGKAVALIWPKDARVMGIRRMTGADKWRITVRLWNPDNTARYESAILSKEAKDGLPDNQNDRPRGLEARLLD